MMIVVEALTSGDPGQHDGIPRRVVIVPLASPVTGRVDERRQHRDIQHGVDTSGEETGRQPHDEAEDSDADGESEEPV